MLMSCAPISLERCGVESPFDDACTRAYALAVVPPHWLKCARQFVLERAEAIAHANSMALLHTDISCDPSPNRQLVNGHYR